MWRLGVVILDGRGDRAQRRGNSVLQKRVEELHDTSGSVRVQTEGRSSCEVWSGQDRADVFVTLAAKHLFDGKYSKWWPKLLAPSAGARGR